MKSHRDRTRLPRWVKLLIIHTVLYTHRSLGPGNVEIPEWVSHPAYMPRCVEMQVQANTTPPDSVVSTAVSAPQQTE